MWLASFFHLHQGVSLKTTPEKKAPPDWVVPYRLPALSRTNLPAGNAPSFPPVNLCSTISLPVVSSLKTTPHPKPLPHAKSPPESVVPYRFPALSRTNPASGSAPSAPPVKLWSTVSLPVVPSLKTTPHPGKLKLEGRAGTNRHAKSPPAPVVPYRLPATSRSKPGSPKLGFAPSAPPVKLCSTVTLSVISSLKTTPHPGRHAVEPPTDAVPYRLPALSRTKLALGSAPSDKPVNAWSTAKVGAGSCCSCATS